MNIYKIHKSAIIHIGGISCEIENDTMFNTETNLLGVLRDDDLYYIDQLHNDDWVNLLDQKQRDEL